MSTVLRPVGPHEPRVYWVRRAVVIAIVAILIVVVAEACSGGGSGNPAANRGHPGTTPSASTSTSSSPAPSTAATSPATTAAACDPTALKLVLSTDSDVYTSGQEAKLTGVFSNPASAPCTLSRAPSQEVWTVESGTDKIWTTQGCAKTTPAKQVTIKAGGTKTISTLWDGHRLDPHCAEGTAALNGEYTLHATLDGVTGEIAIFHVTSAA